MFECVFTQAFNTPWVLFERPISHFVDRIPSEKAKGDSSLKAAGGFSIDMKLWWYIEWPDAIRRRTLLYIRSKGINRLIRINALEYATIIISFVTATYFFTKINPDPTDPYPVALIEADNTCVESWMIKGCKTSCIEKKLGLLQCTLMINNPVGASTKQVSTTDNIIADGILRVDKANDANSFFCLLQQAYPELRSCCQFYPSAELVSAVTRILLQEQSIESPSL